MNVLHAIMGAENRAEVAALVGLAESTIATHIGRMLRRTGTHDQTRLVVWAYETGTVQPRWTIGRIDPPGRKD
jgi:DNA-binding NarL/FixJ family response regulator